jgi:predicted nucleic acid-binding protein
MASGSSPIWDYSRVAYDPSIVDMQERVYEGLTTAFLSELGRDDSFFVDDIPRFVEREFGVKSVPHSLVLASLDRLAERGYIVRKNKEWKLGPVSLPKRPSSELARLVLGELMERARARIKTFDEYQKTVLEKCFENVLYVILNEFGGEVTKAISLVDTGNSSSASLEKTVTDTIAEFKDAQVGDSKELADAAITSLRDVFENPSPEFSDAMWTIGSSYVILKILSADPELQQLRRATFEGGILVLDTNVVIDAICGSCSSHDASIALLKSCQALGFRIVVQTATEEELNRTIAKDTLRYKAQRGRYVDPGFATRDIPKTFYESRSSYKDWYAFVAALKSSYSQFRSDFGVECLDLLEHVEDDAEVAKVSSLVSRQINSLEKTKDPEALSHDAISIVAVQSLKAQSESVLAGPWFLTRDSGVIRASGQYSRMRRLQLQAAIGYQPLLQLIAPFISGIVDADEVAKTFSKILRSRIVPLTKEDVRAFVTYTFEAAGIEADESLMISVISETHASRTFQKSLFEFATSDLLTELKDAVQKVSVDDASLARKDEALKRLVAAVKDSKRVGVAGRLIVESELARLVSDISNKLRIVVRAIGCPSTEREVHKAMETMLATIGYDYDHEKDKHGFSLVGTIPDFTVRLSNLKYPIEVKFVDKESKIPDIIEEMTSDQPKYHKVYKSILFLVYDLGFIADIGKFSKDFEDQGDIVLVVKH